LLDRLIVSPEMVDKHYRIYNELWY